MLTVQQRREEWQRRVHPKKRAFVRRACPSRQWWTFRRMNILTMRALRHDELVDNFFAPSPFQEKLLERT